MTRLQWAELEIALAHQVIPTLDLDAPEVVDKVGILYGNLLATRDDLTPLPEPEPEPKKGINSDAKYLTAKEAAVYLGLPYSTFRKVAVQIKRNSDKRYDREALEAWSARRRR